MLGLFGAPAVIWRPENCVPPRYSPGTTFWKISSLARRARWACRKSSIGIHTASSFSCNNRMRLFLQPFCCLNSMQDTRQNGGHFQAKHLVATKPVCSRNSMSPYSGLSRHDDAIGGETRSSKMLDTGVSCIRPICFPLVQCKFELRTLFGNSVKLLTNSCHTYNCVSSFHNRKINRFNRGICCKFYSGFFTVIDRIFSEMSQVFQVKLIIISEKAVVGAFWDHKTEQRIFFTWSRSFLSLRANVLPSV